MRPHRRGMCGVCEGGSIPLGMVELTHGSSAVSCLGDTKIDHRGRRVSAATVEAPVHDERDIECR